MTTQQTSITQAVNTEASNNAGEYGQGNTLNVSPNVVVDLVFGS